MKKRIRILLFGMAASVALAAAPAANAGIFRAYLSVNGSDTNPCTLPLPCRLLPAALAAVNDGGEIWMLDSANFNGTTVAINKSVTILAVPGALGSVVANNADAIFIDAGVSKITLRNLVVLNLAGSTNNGVRMLNGSGLTVEGCEFYGLLNGIVVTAAGSTVTIRDSTVRDTTSAVVLNGTIKASLRNVGLVNNSLHGLAAMEGARVSFGKGSITGSAAGIMAAGGSSTSTRVTVNDAVLSENVNAVQVSSAANLGEVVLGSSAIVNNLIGVSITDATSLVHSRLNNAFQFNGTNVLGGAMVPSGAQ